MNPKIQAMIEAARAKKLLRDAEYLNNNIVKVTLDPEAKLITSSDQYGNTIELNAAQSEFVKLAAHQRKSCCLIGAAGTGKTTTMKATVAELESVGVGQLASFGHKHLIGGTPAILGCAYTRNAVNNLKRNMPKHMKRNCLTIHKLLEYSPIFEERINPDTGEFEQVRIFKPLRNATRPLDSSIKVIIIEEASMPSVELFLELLDAIAHEVQFIFLGDINQLPPVMGTAILGYAMLALPTVEITEVYRNAGPIIELAHRVKSGKPLTKAEFAEYEVPNIIKIQPWKKKLFSEDAVVIASRVAISLIDHKYLDPIQDIILCPYNKAFGTIEINKHIANHLSKLRNSPTYEIITGFSTNYFAVGDKVLYDKEPAVITSISNNMAYLGKTPQPHSVDLDRWGILNTNRDTQMSMVNGNLEPRDIDDILAMYEQGGDELQEAKRQASHVITLRLTVPNEDDFEEDDLEVTLSSAGEVNKLDLGYAITIHKSQGSEYRNVLVLLHHSHNTMVARELLYTAITRTKKSIHIICEEDTFVKGINSQRIKGTTLAEKAEFFKGKAANADLTKLRFN